MEDFAAASREHAQTPEGATGQRQSSPSGDGAEPEGGGGAQGGAEGTRGGTKGFPSGNKKKDRSRGGTGEEHERWGRNLKGWNGEGSYKGPQKGAGDKGEGIRWGWEHTDKDRSRRPEGRSGGTCRLRKAFCLASA